MSSGFSSSYGSKTRLRKLSPSWIVMLSVFPLYRMCFSPSISSYALASAKRVVPSGMFSKDAVWLCDEREMVFCERYPPLSAMSSKNPPFPSSSPAAARKAVLSFASSSPLIKKRSVQVFLPPIC